MNKRPSDNSRWLHKGQTIEPSNRIEILCDDKEHEVKLIINNADENGRRKIYSILYKLMLYLESLNRYSIIILDFFIVKINNIHWNQLNIT